jgi:Zn finger protein HypA/HybF involved in hydrogenase expression
MLDFGIGTNEIARALGVSRATVAYHKARLGCSMEEPAGVRYDWAAIQRYYDDDHSVAECIERYGFSRWAWAYAVKRGAIVPRPKSLPLDQLLKQTPRSRNNIKLRLITAGIKPCRCERCGIARWHKHPLSLCLHHINGDRHDNRLENLELLCPNCHSQTPNFGSKNKRLQAA